MALDSGNTRKHYGSGGTRNLFRQDETEEFNISISATGVGSSTTAASNQTAPLR